MLERVGSQVLLVAMWISNVAARAFVMSDILEPSVFCEWKNRPHHCFYHIACKTRETEQCAEVLPLPVHVAELIVDLHNHCRDHAISKRPHDPPEFFITYPRLGHLPPSAGLMQLFWDEELADMASQWVGTCTIQSKAARSTEKTFKPPPPPREHNVYQSYNLTRNKSIEYEKEFCFDVSRFPVKGWLWISKEHHEVKMDDQWRTLLWEFCSDVSRNLPQYIIESYRPPHESLGAYFREEGVSMLWGKTVRVGCGHRLPKEDESYGVRFSALACLYGPAPLQLGARVYEVGKSGSACPPQAPVGSAYFPNLCVPQKSKWEIAVIIVPVVVALCLAAACLAYAPQF